MTDSLLDLVRQVREQCGRPMDDAALQRVQQKISAFTPSEVTAEKNMLRHLLTYAGKVPKP